MTDIVERLREENAVMRQHLHLHPTMPLGDDLRQKLVEAAAFLDGLADRLEGHGNANRHTAADDCRAMAKKLRGET